MILNPSDRYKIKKVKNSPTITITGILLLFGSNPVSGRPGIKRLLNPDKIVLVVPLTRTDSPYVPTAQLSVAATRIQIA